MNLRLVTTIAAIVWLFACAGQPTSSGGSSTNQPRKNLMIHVSDGSLNPANAQLESGGTVIWVNRASEFSATINLSLETVSKLGCGDLRPDFGEVATGWRSNVLTPGDDMEVQLSCPAPPGEYDYKVNLGRGSFDIDNPQLQLDGKIVVK